MPNIFTFVLALLILLASFFEFIVFNDEVLLTLCFVSFVFFAYSTLNKTFFDLFEDRANKFEADLLLAFMARFEASTIHSQDILFVKGLFVKQEIFELLTDKQVHTTLETSNKMFSTDAANFLNTKLVEVFAQEQKIFALVQESCIQTVLYPIIFSLGKDYMAFIKDVKRTPTKSL
jgi:hypothetical protein